MMNFGEIKSNRDMSDLVGWSKMWEDQEYHCPHSYSTGGFVIDTGTTMVVSTMLVSVEKQGNNFDLLMPVIAHNHPSNGKCKVKLYGMKGNRSVEISNGTNLSDTVFHIIAFGN
jgi:hypothetical protein